MNVNSFTSDAPVAGMAYRFNVPTGGIAKGRSPRYRGWTEEVVFQGDWTAAALFGVIRSQSGVDATNWPSSRIFRYPEDVFRDDDDPDAAALLRIYDRKLKEFSAQHPDLSDKECQLRSAEAAQRECDS